MSGRSSTLRTALVVALVLAGGVLIARSLGWFAFSDQIAGEGLVVMEPDEKQQMQSEILVVLENVDAETTLQRLKQVAKVTQIASPRVLVMEGPTGASEIIRAVPGVASVHRDLASPDVLDDLDEQESLFVAAWNLRQEETPKTRTGEGKAWDAEGFDAPDAPSGNSE